LLSQWGSLGRRLAAAVTSTASTADGRLLLLARRLAARAVATATWGLAAGGCATARAAIDEQTRWRGEHGARLGDDTGTITRRSGRRWNCCVHDGAGTAPAAC